MTLLDNDHLQKLVDYSFGDHSGVLGGVPQAFMKKANKSNVEFLRFVAYSPKKTITLFIDNIRLYRRPIEYSDWLHMKPVSAQDRQWLDQFEDEDLLSLCSEFPDTNFIIFTAFEDTPLDDYIWDKIPENVVSIHAANAVVFGGKVKPFPHGLERHMYEGYDHQTILRYYLKFIPAPSRRLLYVNHREDTGDRGSLRDMFRDKDWALVSEKVGYEEYLSGISQCKFVLCPSGNGIESARNWETLYMGKVPIFKDHPYLREMFKDFPAIFVKDFADVTKEMLEAYEMPEHDRRKLDLLVQFKERTNV